MLTNEERTLPKNIIEALNRLYDRQSSVTDVHALLVATAAAFRGTGIAAALETPIRQVLEIVKSDALPDRKRDLGLDATDELRKFVGAELHRDTVENPRQRHKLSG